MGITSIISSISIMATLLFDLESQLNQKHPLYLLANKIGWEVFEEAFKGLYCANNGLPAKPIRRMAGLLILKESICVCGVFFTDHRIWP